MKTKTRPAPIQVSPTERDIENVEVIEQAQPQLTSNADVLRHALELAANKYRRTKSPQQTIN